MNRQDWLKRFLVVCAAAAGLAISASAQSVTATTDRSPGSYSRDTTVTGPNGKTATYQNNRSWGNGSYQDTRSYTGANGATRTDTRTRGDGRVTNTYTGRKGNSRTFSHAVRFRR